MIHVAIIVRVMWLVISREENKNSFNFMLYCLGGYFCAGPASFDPIFFPLHSYIDAMYTWWQLLSPDRQMIRMSNDYVLIWYNVYRRLYVDNSNLGGRGMKIKYTPIF